MYKTKEDAQRTKTKSTKREGAKVSAGVQNWPSGRWIGVRATYPGKVGVGLGPLLRVKPPLAFLERHLRPEYCDFAVSLLLLLCLLLGFRGAGGSAPLSLELTLSLPVGVLLVLQSRHSLGALFLRLLLRLLGHLFAPWDSHGSHHHISQLGAVSSLNERVTRRKFQTVSREVSAGLHSTRGESPL